MQTIVLRREQVGEYVLELRAVDALGKRQLLVTGVGSWAGKTLDFDRPDEAAKAYYDLLAQLSGLKKLSFIYKNYKGVTAKRKIETPAKLYYGSNEWHKEPQWLLEAYDCDKGELRAFALADCKLEDKEFLVEELEPELPLEY